MAPLLEVSRRLNGITNPLPAQLELKSLLARHPGLSAALFDRGAAVTRWSIPERSRWPFNPDEFDICGIAQTEVGVRSILTCITAAARDLAHLPARLARDCCLHANLRSKAGPIGDTPGALDDQPIIAVSVVAVEKIILIIQIRHEQIEESIVVVVSRRSYHQWRHRSPGCPW